MIDNALTFYRFISDKVFLFWLMAAFTDFITIIQQKQKIIFERVQAVLVVLWAFFDISSVIDYINLLVVKFV